MNVLPYKKAEEVRREPVRILNNVNQTNGTQSNYALHCLRQRIVD